MKYNGETRISKCYIDGKAVDIYVAGTKVLVDDIGESTIDQVNIHYSKDNIYITYDVQAINSSDMLRNVESCHIGKLPEKEGK